VNEKNITKIIHNVYMVYKIKQEEHILFAVRIEG